MLKQLLISAIAIAPLFLSPSPTVADSTRKITLSVYPLNSREIDVTYFPQCPTEIAIAETPRPYQEGGYTIDGIASLSWLARTFKIEQSDNFSVIWAGKLQPKYANCRASASISKMDGEDFTGHSYLRMRLIDKKAYLILDMTGMRDANDLTTVILQKGVKSGNPTWTWGGSD